MIPMRHLDASGLAKAWECYKADGDADCRNELILHYSSLVEFVAGKIGGTLPPQVDRDDLVSYGMFGLIDAIDKFDLGKGVKFETYGVARIRGAIYDEIRSQDWVPRSVRSKARDIEKARTELEAQFGRPASHGEVATALGLTMEEFWELSSAANATQLTHLADGSANDNGGGVDHLSTKIDPTSNPADLFESEEIVDLIGEAVTHMDERSKTILVLYYLQEMTLKDIGEILGVTESRVCQLQSKILTSLRDSLGRGGLAAA